MKLGQQPEFTRYSSGSGSPHSSYVEWMTATAPALQSESPLPQGTNMLNPTLTMVGSTIIGGTQTQAANRMSYRILALAVISLVIVARSPSPRKPPRATPGNCKRPTRAAYIARSVI